MSIIKDKHYLEELARITLIHLLDYSEDNLFCAESPDIQSVSKNVGIEVICDIFEKEAELQRIIEEIWGQPISNIPETRLSHFERLGGKIRINETGRITGASLGNTTISSKHIIASVTKKLKKLNGHYSTFPENDLYVFVDSIQLECNESYIYSLMEFVKNYSGKKNLIFNHLFLDQHYILYDCDIQTMRFKKYMISKEFKDLRDRKATQICPN